MYIKTKDGRIYSTTKPELYGECKRSSRAAYDLCALRKKLKWDTDNYSKMWSGYFERSCYWVFLPKHSTGI